MTSLCFLGRNDDKPSIPTAETWTRCGGAGLQVKAAHARGYSHLVGRRRQVFAKNTKSKERELERRSCRPAARRGRRGNGGEKEKVERVFADLKNFVEKNRPRAMMVVVCSQRSSPGCEETRKKR
ncbi:unnamed protein product [Heligmosomoides polygyrus]|uniref:50S ribosomal protein L28 n=1 Tax=Heligmosomoides polygyrus TaxID=6339 RepID=A0A183G1R2_HELPZ|nr:unnamed protein product [Heligmosomoides polygyrus]